MRRLIKKGLSAKIFALFVSGWLFLATGQAAALPSDPGPESREYSGEFVSMGEVTPEIVARSQYEAERAITRQAAAALAGAAVFSGHGYSAQQLEAAAFGTLQVLETESKSQIQKNTKNSDMWLRVKGRIDPVKMKEFIDNRILLNNTVKTLEKTDVLLGQINGAVLELKKTGRADLRDKLTRRLQEQELRFKANVWLLKGNRAMANGDYAMAEDAYTHSLEMGGEAAWLLVARGNALYYQGAYDRAALDYTAALVGDNRQANVYYYRGNVYYYQNRYDEALADYTAALALDPTDAATLYNRANVYRKKAMLEQAVTDYTAALAINRRMINAYANRGDIYLRLNRPDAALADYQEALNIDPADAGVLYSRGNLNSQQGNYEAAIADYSAALAVNPRLAVAYQNRGAAYLKKNLFAQAVADFDQALAQEPRYAVAYFNKAVTMEKMTFADDVPPLDVVARIRQIIDAYRNFLQYAPADHPGIERARERIKFLESRTMVLDI